MKDKMVRVSWVDANSFSGWIRREEAESELKPGRFTSVGFLIRRSKKRVTIAGSQGCGKTGDTLTIPTGCILKVEELEVKR